jgi:hypothetical protein
MVETTDAELAAAKERWGAEITQRPIPSSVRFDGTSGRIVVEFQNGAAFMVPARSLEGLADASDAELAEVELLGETGLHWENLDIDYLIAGLMNGVFGSHTFMEAQRKGGQSRSPAKIAASRANGTKGGRPKKTTQTT